MLLLLMFGCVEVGKYFMDEHIVVKAVRDGARFAARQQMTNFITSAGVCQAPPQAIADNTKNLVRTGNVAGAGSRLSYWTSNATIEVTSACHANAGGQSMDGIYSGVTFNGAPVGAPVVTVSATVPYSPLLGLFGVRGGVNLTASQQAVVTGV